MSFDITVAFDRAKYLDVQARLFVDTLKDNIPEDTILHVVTNRGKNDEIRKYIKENINSKFYYIRKTDELQSRCRYMLNCFQIHSNKKWIVKMELDLLVLKHLKEFEDILDDDLDIIVETENRKIFDDVMEERLWRQMFKAMNISKPNFKVQFRENNEMGLPLFGSGIVCVKTEHLKKINERWIPLTKICERWGSLGVHPNEVALTGLILDEGWKWKIYPPYYKYNIIGHHRKGSFPSIELEDNPIIPDILILDWHRINWLYEITVTNPRIMKIIERNKDYLNKSSNVNPSQYVEKF